MYRGYVYDEETGLYYLHSRYYCSKVERFTNADNYLLVDLSSLMQSVYSYCLNNPSNCIDRNGHSASSALNEDVADLFKRIGEVIKREICYNLYDRGDSEKWKYEKKTVVKTGGSAEKMITKMMELGSSAVSGYLSTALISLPWLGAVAATAQFVTNELASKYIDLTIPDIPDGVYTLESACYKEKTPGLIGDFLSGTYSITYYYLHGYDESGCAYYAVWYQTYTYGFAIEDSSSWVLAQRTQ